MDIQTDEEADEIISDLSSKLGSDTTGLTMKDAIFNPQYCKATWVNIGYIFFHEFAGINVINLYSS